MKSSNTFEFSTNKKPKSKGFTYQRLFNSINSEFKENFIY